MLCSGHPGVTTQPGTTRQASLVWPGLLSSLNAGRARHTRWGPGGRRQLRLHGTWVPALRDPAERARSEGDHREHQLRPLLTWGPSAGPSHKEGTHEGLAAPAHPVRGQGPDSDSLREALDPGSPQRGWGLCWHPESRLGPPARPTPRPVTSRVLCQLRRPRPSAPRGHREPRGRGGQAAAACSFCTQASADMGREECPLVLGHRAWCKR